MSKNYTQSTASLKTTTHDTFILDAQKVMVYPGSGDRALRVNVISIVNDAVDRIGDLETTVSSLDDTYVAKTDYSTFVSSTNSSISTINTTLGNCAKTNTTNTFTKAITFNSTTNTKGNATFGTNIIKSTTASDPSTATLTHVLNKGENDKLYAPITLSDTVSSLETDITTVSTVIADHQTDTSLHVSSSEKEEITSLIANKDNFANKAEDTAFAKSVTVAGGATFDSTITKSNNTTSPTDTSVLNKGENDDLYAPISLSTTVTNLSNTVNGLGSTYVAKTTYNSFVTSTNNSISTLNTNVGKCALKTDLNSYVTTANLNTTLGSYTLESDLATTLKNYALKTDLNSYVTLSSLTTTLGSYATTASLSAYAKVGSANTFTGANTFNSTTTTKGNATFNSNIIKSTTSSTPSSLDDTYVLNKGENNKLYAPASLSTTVSDHTGSSSLHLNSTQIADLTTFNTNKNNYLLKATADSTYAPIALSTTVSSHTSDTTVHLTSTEHTNLTTLISNKDNYANKTAATTFSKTLGVTGATTLSSTLTVIGATTLNGNLQAKEAFIENLTIKELTVLEEGNQGTSKKAETYEEATFNGVVLDFADDYNCVYTTATDSILEADTTGKLLNITFEVPESLGSKLVCRYLVLDLRNENTSTVIGTSYNGAENLRWLYGMPDIEAGYFYVLAFQRFTKDLIVGNVAVKLEK